MVAPLSHFMALALAEAEAGAQAGEVPVGALIVKDGIALAAAQNRVERDRDPTAHAEILAIRAACSKMGEARLAGAELIVTLEPCAMCAQAIAFARIAKLVFAAYDPKGGGVDHGARIFDRASCHHHPEVIGGLMETEASARLRAFFAGLRKG
ncbi:MAG: nucleoside deaminase [Rhodospirillales bacterium]|nr:nucleoside deaminase [Rhodospirillales bacterium]